MAHVGLPEEPSIDDLMTFDVGKIKDLSRQDLFTFLSILGVDVTTKWDTVRMRKKFEKILNDGEVPEQKKPTENVDPTLAAVLSMVEEMKAQSVNTQSLIAALQEGSGNAANDGDGTQQNPPIRTIRTPSKLNVKGPDKLEDGCSYRQFRRWIISWKNFAKASNIETLSREQQVSTFFSYLEPKMLTKVEYAMKISVNETELTVEEIITKIGDFLKEQKNIMVSRHDLVKKRQAERQSFDDFLVEIREMAEEADVENMSSEDLIATLLVCGTSDNDARTELLAKRNVTLDTVIRICRSREKADKDQKSLSKPVAGVRQQSNNRTRRARSQSQNRSRNSNKNSRDKPEKFCFNCGGPYPHNGECPAKNRHCHFCKMEGHYSRCCKDKKDKPSDSNADGKTKSKTSGHIYRLISGLESRSEHRPTIAIDVYDMKNEYLDNKICVADTGAELTVGGTGLLKRFGISRKNLKKPNERLSGVNAR